MARPLSLVAGGSDGARAGPGRQPVRAAGADALPPPAGRDRPLPGDGAATLHELFATHPRDGGWIGFLLSRLDPGRPWLWVQDRMAILETGRLHPPALGAAAAGLIHVTARDARDALWAVEEGLRCEALGAVVGECWGDPAALDFTATRRLAVAAERHGVAAYLVRLGGHAALSGARFRWRLASAPSLANPFDPRAPGAAAWQAELFRARGAPPGQWMLVDEARSPQARAADDGGVAAAPVDRALDRPRAARA